MEVTSTRTGSLKPEEATKKEASTIINGSEELRRVMPTMIVMTRLGSNYFFEVLSSLKKCSAAFTAAIASPVSTTIVSVQ